MSGKKRTDNKGRILRNGEMQRTEDGRYLYRYTDLTGKKRTVYAVTLAELREKEKQIERDLQDGIDSSKGNMTLNQLFQIYMETKSDVRKSTRHNYFVVWKNAIENSDLGNMKIAQIKQIHIRKFYSELVKSGMAANTIKLYHNLINPALELAVDSDIIRKNPAKDCKKGIGGTKKERIAMTINEQEKLLNFIKFFHKRYKIPLLQNEDIHKYPLYQHFIKFSHNFSTHLLTVLTKSVIVISQVEQSVLK